MVQSSGDEGVGCGGPNDTIFSPSSEGTCPYVLAVGATQWSRANSSSSRNDSTTSHSYYESSTDYSGGGFSNYFATPSWQTDAVSAYFDRVNLNFTGYTVTDELNFNMSDFDFGGGVYHVGGRGYPDVSAIGESYMAYYKGRWGHVSGTSLSAPIWAALLTLVNERRLAANKSTVGFVHPVLVSC